MEESFSWREELKGEMRREDQPWMRATVMSLATLPAVAAARRRGVDNAPAKNDWEVRKRGRLTPLSRNTGCEGKRS